MGRTPSPNWANHADDFLARLALGLLDLPTRALVEAHVKECDRCARKLEMLGCHLGVTPRAEQVSRFDKFIEAVAQMFDVRTPRARALLDLVDDVSCWQPGQTSLQRIFPLDGGQRVQDATCRMVRATPGARLSLRGKGAFETLLILQGSLVDDDGVPVTAGEVAAISGADSRGLTVLPGDELVACSVRRDRVVKARETHASAPVREDAA